MPPRSTPHAGASIAQGTCDTFVSCRDGLKEGILGSRRGGPDLPEKHHRVLAFPSAGKDVPIIHGPDALLETVAVPRPTRAMMSTVPISLPADPKWIPAPTELGRRKRWFLKRLASDHERTRRQRQRLMHLEIEAAFQYRRHSLTSRTTCAHGGAARPG